MHRTSRSGRGAHGRSPRCLLVASLGLVACGGDDEEAAAAAAAAAASEDYKMTLIAGVKGDEFYITMNCGAQAEAKKQGVDARLPGSRTSSTPRCRRRSSTASSPRSPTRS